MDTKRFSYEGIGGAVAGMLGIVGVLGTWWEVGGLTFDGTSDTTGEWAFALAIGTFAFGVAYVLLSDPAIRKISGILMAVSAALMTGAAIAGIGRADDVVVDATVGTGLWITLVAGAIGMISGVLAVKAAYAMGGAEATPAPMDAPGGSADPMSG